MTGRIPQAFIDDLLARTDIVELIDKRVSLRKMGANYSARCPFHTEKTPSFTVSPTKQFYYCFGCSAHGNAIGFLMQYERLEFMDAVESLAAKVGMEIPREAQSYSATAQQQDLFNALTAADKYYQQQLRQTQPAIDYLKSRGLSGEIAKRFGIGYAPDAWDKLTFAIGKDESTKKNLVTTGMLIQNKEGKYLDRFRARIMFPIRDIRGRVIGFGGRTLGKDMPKYLNSPETPLFHKSHELYGLYEARQASNKLERVLIVEGYMDVVALAQHGIPYVVATLGTAPSQHHVQRLLRYTQEIYFCFDGDAAGQKAAWRALEIALPVMQDGLQIFFMFLPASEDPDSFIRSKGQTAFEELIKAATPLSDFFFQQLSHNVDLTTADGKARLANRAKELLNKIPQGIFQQLMLEKLGKIIGTNVAILQSTAEIKETVIENKNIKMQPTSSSRTRSPIQLTIMLLLQHPELVNEIQDLNFLRALKLPGIEVLIKIIEILKENPHITIGALLEHWREHKSADKLAKLAAQEHLIPAEGLQDEFRGAMTRLIESGRDNLIQLLLTKAKQQELTPAEKSQLQQLLSTKNPA